MRRLFDIKSGDKSLKLCSIYTDRCFQTRVVMMARKFPMFSFSSLFFMNFVKKPNVLISQGQYNWLMKELTYSSKNVTTFETASNNLVIKLPKDRGNISTQLMTLKQDIRSHLSSSSRARIIDYEEIKVTLYFAVQVMLYLFWIIAGLLYVMIFYQVILVVESILRQSQ